MYETTAPAPMTSDKARNAYRIFLADLNRMESALKRVISEWPISCEQFLSNEHINRIAWLGQSSMCIETRVPACFRGGFRLLSPEQQEAANRMALKYLNTWLRSKGQNESAMTLDMSDDNGADEWTTNLKTTTAKASFYISSWQKRGYTEGVPDEVPIVLMKDLLAPSYKAVAQAILKIDMQLKSLGFVPPQS